MLIVIEVCSLSSPREVNFPLVSRAAKPKGHSMAGIPTTGISGNGTEGEQALEFEERLLLVRLDTGCALEVEPGENERRK